MKHYWIKFPCCEFSKIQEITFPWAPFKSIPSFLMNLKKLCGQQIKYQTIVNFQIIMILYFSFNLLLSKKKIPILNFEILYLNYYRALFLKDIIVVKKWPQPYRPIKCFDRYPNGCFFYSTLSMIWFCFRYQH